MRIVEVVLSDGSTMYLPSPFFGRDEIKMTEREEKQMNCEVWEWAYTKLCHIQGRKKPDYRIIRV